MSAFFFGPPARQLLGYHHAARGTPQSAVLICQPWGREYQYAHRTLNFLGRRLAGAGAHVMRFDYSGTGDSWGGTEEVELEQWEEDVVLAVTELRAMSGMDRIDLLGLRLGALLAARGAAAASRVRRLVLWDPVVDGSAWVRELGTVRANGRAGLLDVGGLLSTTQLVRRFEEIGVDDYQNLQGDQIFLLLTQPDDPDGVGSELLAGMPGVEVERLEQPAPWIEDSSIWTGQVPVEAVRRITEWLS